MNTEFKSKKVVVVSHLIPFDGILVPFLENKMCYEVLFQASTFELFFKKVSSYEDIDRIFVEIDHWDDKVLILINKAVKSFPAAEMVILGNYCDPDYLLRIMRAGAVGFILRNEDMSAFGAELKQLDENGGFISPIAISFMSHHFRGNTETTYAFRGLSSRHRRIMELLSAGETILTASQKMGLNRYCFRFHIQRISSEFKVNNIQAAVRAYKSMDFSRNSYQTHLQPSAKFG